MTTAADIKAALEAYYTSYKYTLAYEVGVDGRQADAVAMCLWPSQGYNIQGFEIKVSRSDWQRELKNPAKADAVARYCDRWWVVTPPGLVRAGELPETRGLIEVIEGKLNVATRAARRDAKPVDRAFMVGMLRRADGIDAARLGKAVRLETEAIAAEAQRQVEHERAVLQREYDPAIKLINDAEKQTGLRLRWMLDSKKLVSLMRVANALGMHEDDYKGLSGLAHTLRSVAREAGELVEKVEDAATKLQARFPATGSEDIQP